MLVSITSKNTYISHSVSGVRTNITGQDSELKTYDKGVASGSFKWGFIYIQAFTKFSKHADYKTSA